MTAWYEEENLAGEERDARSPAIRIWRVIGWFMNGVGPRRDRRTIAEEDWSVLGDLRLSETPRGK